MLKTPRHGTAFLQRLVVVLPDTPVDSPWTVGHERARAMAEPRLNAWLGTMFGNPRRVQWTVVASAGVTHAADLSLLSLAPIDVVAFRRRRKSRGVVDALHGKVCTIVDIVIIVVAG